MRLNRSLLAFVATAFLATSLQAPALAASIATPSVLGGGAAFDRAGELARVQSVLARDEVRTALEARGVDPAQAAARVAALSDAELRQLGSQLDQLPAGGDLLAVIGIVFVVLLILELTGVTDIFKKI